MPIYVFEQPFNRRKNKYVRKAKPVFELPDDQKTKKIIDLLETTYKEYRNAVDQQIRANDMLQDAASYLSKPKYLTYDATVELTNLPKLYKNSLTLPIEIENLRRKFNILIGELGLADKITIDKFDEFKFSSQFLELPKIHNSPIAQPKTKKAEENKESVSSEASNAKQPVHLPKLGKG